jgi:toxin ParE1/3/4
MKVRYSQRAADDLVDIFSYIANENPFAAARVVDRIEAVASSLGDRPGMGTVTDQQSIRRFPVSGTPYLIFYEVFEDEVAIIHIRHGARQPWTKPR